jgi:hypothetical protein
MHESRTTTCMYVCMHVYIFVCVVCMYAYQQQKCMYVSIDRLTRCVGLELHLWDLFHMCEFFLEPFAVRTCRRDFLLHVMVVHQSALLKVNQEHTSRLKTTADLHIRWVQIRQHTHLYIHTYIYIVLHYRYMISHTYMLLRAFITYDKHVN